jgi:hypothetical protein
MRVSAIEPTLSGSGGTILGTARVLQLLQMLHATSSAHLAYLIGMLLPPIDQRVCSTSQPENIHSTKWMQAILYSLHASGLDLNIIDISSSGIHAFRPLGFTVGKSEGNIHGIPVWNDQAHPFISRMYCATICALWGLPCTMKTTWETFSSSCCMRA